ncbi:MAG TPA: multiheme c-type cytochrome, partial [Thermoanaerobaculia bacterium]|nr:multiheme c-type cytochrome [Thermoanaerobaculia bacterium]
MTVLRRTRAWLPAVAASLVVAAASPPTAAPPPAATPPRPPSRGEAVRSGAGAAYLAGHYVGPGPCAAANCHGNLEPGQVYDVLQNEYYTWSADDDPHRHAADVLFNQQSRLIAKNLKLAQSADRSSRCLVCHAVAAPPSVQAVPLELADGVSCEACHGPAGGWLARHNETGWNREDSLAAGMVDLRDPVARGRVCLDCHGGKAGRQVDHELL